MSMDLHVCWKGELAMDKPRLAQALSAAGFSATILYDLPGSQGYWPIDIDGFRSGVEVYFDDDLHELRDIYPVLAAALGERDRGATFTFGSDAAEAGVACALAAAICRLGDVVVYEPSEGVIYSADRATEEARNMFQIALREGYRERQDGPEQD